MPDVTIKEVAATQSITNVATDISCVIVDTERGPTDTPVFVSSFDQFQDWFGYYKSGSYSGYAVEEFFLNGGKGLWVIRVAGDNASSAGGADGYKLDISKAQVIIGAGASELDVQSVARGTDGTQLNLTITNNTSDVTTAVITNDYDIELKLASASAWKKSANVCATVLSGVSHVVLAAHAVPAADNSVVFIADTAGDAGNSCSVTVIDSGAAGLAVSYDATGYKMTINLGGATPTASAVNTAVNTAAGSITSYVAGAGSGTWNAVVAETYLASGSTEMASLVIGSTGGTGLGAVAATSKTWFTGTGTITGGSSSFTDTVGLSGFSTIANYVIPGDKLIVYNGANKGSYTIDEVTSAATFTIEGIFATTQTTAVYAVMGTNGAYGHFTADLVSPGERGDSFSLFVEKEFGDATLKATLSVTDGDSATRVLEVHEGLSPVSTSPDFIETIIASDSEWVTVDAFAENVLTTGTGSSSAGDATLTDAGATFVDDGVEEGAVFICTSATTAGDIRVYTVASVTDNTHLKVDVNFIGTQADVVYTIVDADATGNALMSLVGSDGLTITFAGGVDDTPIKTDYLGSSSLKTGVYAIDDIPISSRPSKLDVPDAPIIVDSLGVDATNLVNKAMGEFCSDSGRQYLRYSFSSERGLSPSQAVSAAASDGIDNKFVTEYYNWGKVNDPVTGTDKLIPLSTAMMGQAVGVSAGQFGKEGDHDAAANVQIVGVTELEYKVSQAEAELLNNANINCIRDWYGIRNMGDRVRTTDSAWKWLHKRDTAIRLNQSIFQSLKTWVNFKVNALDTYGKIEKVTDAYLKTEDRTENPTGALLNVKNPNEAPYYVNCKWTTPGNDLSKTKIYLRYGYSIVNTVEDAEIQVSLWDGGASLTES